MKKSVFLSVSVLLMLAGCNGNKQNVSEATEPVQTESVVDSTTRVVDGSNARTALDYQGTYKGSIPGASGTINTTIVLTDTLYTKTLQYENQIDKVFTSGKYSWNTDGNTITFIGEEAPNQYFVGENTITQLDTEGKKITGNMADLYIFHKE